MHAGGAAGVDSFTVAYAAARHALAGRYDGDVRETAADIAAALVRRYRIRAPEHLRRIAERPEARRVIVGTVARRAWSTRSEVKRALPLVDEAVAVAAQALLGRSGDTTP